VEGPAAGRGFGDRVLAVLVNARPRAVLADPDAIGRMAGVYVVGPGGDAPDGIFVPAIVFVDELDSLMGAHTNEVGGEIRVRNQFLKEMDGIVDKGKALHVYVIGATNKPWDLDWAFIRRFQKRILVPLADNATRLNMLKLYSSNLQIDPNVDLNELARISEGFSGSDIRDVCQSAQLSLIGEFFESGKAMDKEAKPRALNMADFRQIFEDRKPSVSLDMLSQYNRWFEAFKAL